jgi:hypothetical protein
MRDVCPLRLHRCSTRSCCSWAWTVVSRNFCMNAEEISKLGTSWSTSAKRVLTLVGTNMPGSSLAVVLDDHVVHDHTSLHHDLPHIFLRPSKGRIPNNNKWKLKHTKRPLDILSVALLELSKVEILLTCWQEDCFDKCRPCWPSARQYPFIYWWSLIL